MGIYDRDYYRNDGPSFLGSITNTASVCKWLIMLNVAVFILQLLDMRGVFGPRGMFTRALDLNAGLHAPAEPEQFREMVDDLIRRGDTETLRILQEERHRPGVFQGQVWRLLTYSFLHSPFTFFHIFWNMLFLWWFGSDIEGIYGSKEFLAFYLVSAFMGGVLYVAAQAAGIMGYASAVGASGAVTAIMVLAALHFPTRTILIFFFFPVPLWLLVAFQVGKDFWQFLGGFDTGVAVAVHLGGAFFAFVYYQSQIRLLNLLPDFRAWRARRGRPQLRVYREEEPVVAAPRPVPSDMDEHLEAKVDAVLEKVARHGRESLSEAERQLLLRASELYKKRRT